MSTPPAPVDPTLLVVAPPAEESLPPRLLELVAERGGISLYEARLRLRLPGLPRAVAVVPDPALARRDAALLSGLGVSSQAISRSELRAHRAALKEARSIREHDGGVARIACVDGTDLTIQLGAVVSMMRLRQRVITETAQVTGLRVRPSALMGPSITERITEEREHFDDEELLYLEPGEGPPLLLRASTLLYTGDPAQKTYSQNLNFRITVAPLVAMVEPSRVDDQLSKQRIVPGIELLGGDLLDAVVLVALARKKGMTTTPPEAPAVLPRQNPAPARSSPPVQCSNCLAEAQGDVYYLVDQRPYCASCAAVHRARAEAPRWRIARWSREILLCVLVAVLVAWLLLAPNLLLMTPLALGIVWLLSRPFHGGAGVEVVEVRREDRPSGGRLP